MSYRPNKRQYVEEDDTVTSSKLGMNASYIHHLHSHHANVSKNYEGDDDYTDDIFAKHLKTSAKASAAGGSSKDRFSNHSSKSRHSHNSTSKHSSNSNNSSSHRSSSHRSRQPSNASLENSYTQAMNRVSRGGDYYYYDPQKARSFDAHERSSRSNHGRGRSHSNSLGDASRRKESTSSLRTISQHSSSVRNSTSTNGEASLPSVPKKGVSSKDPSEETIALFGAFGVTGHYFLQLAMEAGYKVRALVLPGITLDDVSPASDNLRLITGSFDEAEKIRRVVKNASYVVCLLNDCDKSLTQLKKQQEDARTCAANLENMPPILNHQDDKKDMVAAGSNLKFMQTLLPILEELDTCRVLLYQASSVARDDKGTTPVMGKVVKKLAVSKNTREALREQDKIVKHIVNTTKHTSMNFIVTRPNSDSLIWDRPSRKKLSASKSQPGPFPITNVDLAEFTLGALRMDKIYNTCPYVVQDGL
ncbi:NADPH-binding protein [Nitzschia inconspicua]|uniref:NADPH-binding protein n=1 Tax=Nitzschia inconspicua TaxID=303405 RepID=A0A9K3KYY7_9STRA|nr:NADPH-binding protein [Nitzschia inconspicua]